MLVHTIASWHEIVSSIDIYITPLKRAIVTEFSIKRTTAADEI